MEMIYIKLFTIVQIITLIKKFVYAQFNEASSLSSCQRIFTGRLVDITLNDKQQLSMQINAHRPWDRIKFPQDQETTTKKYIPIVYGDFYAK